MDKEKKETKRPVGRPKSPDTVVVGIRVRKEWAAPVRKAIDNEIEKLKKQTK